MPRWVGALGVDVAGGRPWLGAPSKVSAAGIEAGAPAGVEQPAAAAHAQPSQP